MTTTPYMHRPKITPIMRAVAAIVETLGDPVGLGGAPKGCNPPYYVITTISSPRYTGPFMHAPEADAMDRVQITAVSAISDEQANGNKDRVREAFTVAALDAQFVSDGEPRRTLSLVLDIPRGVQRDERGLPNPRYNAVDQYMIETTPN